jgi:hypothetical protein
VDRRVSSRDEIQDPPDPVITSHWRLFTTAEQADDATAAARSVIAGLLMGQPPGIGATPYFQGGYKVDFSLESEGTWEAVAGEIVEALDRLCGGWVRDESEAPDLELWSNALNVPRIEALGVSLRRDQEDDVVPFEGSEAAVSPFGPGTHS